MLTISDQIRDLVRKSGIPQRELARQAGISCSVLIYFLSGKAINSSNLDAIYRIVGPKSKKKSRT